MPLYRYRCEECQHNEVYNLSVGDKLILCPDCGSKSIKKAFGKIKVKEDSSNHFEVVDRKFQELRQNMESDKQELKDRKFK